MYHRGRRWPLCPFNVKICSLPGVFALVSCLSFWYLAALGGLSALLALFDKCYQEAAVSAVMAFLLSPYGAPQVLLWLGRKLLELAGRLYDLYY